MAYNSIIKPLRGICSDCAMTGDASEKYLIAKRCKTHYERYRNQVSQERKKKRGSLEKDLQRSVDLNEFFDKKIYETLFTEEGRVAFPSCWECGSVWFAPPVIVRSCIAHIFPKSIFRSVMTHDLNWLFLPAECCHDKTHRLDTFSKMRIFPEAVNRFKEFRSHITESHKYLDEFITYAKQQNLL